ncbi:MAG: hypothetical protein QM724_04855 [Flavobacteriales bacterium]
MRSWSLGMAALCALGLHAQQGFLPLSRVVDAPWTDLMHRYGTPAHSAIRPYLQEDVAALPGADSALSKAAFPWLQRMTDPTARWRGGPLVDAQAGPSIGDNDVLKYRAGAGAWLEWSASPRFTFHVDGQYWNETLPNYLDSAARATHVVPGEGWAEGKPGEARSHYDWNAWMDYKAGEHFHLTLGRGKNFFGEGYRSLFLSDEAYSYPYFRITTTAWHIRYVNLFALMDDIRGSGGDPTRSKKKFTSMHYLSWNISKRLNAGLFEAVVWQDNDPRYPRGFDLSYVNPVIFYRPVEYSLGSPDNVLLGFALNAKVGDRTLIYSQLILDEFLLSNIRAGNGWYANKQGLQLGATSHDVLGMDGLTLRGEFNYVRPFLYTHSDVRQNYAHHGQPLAHPYGSNFWEALVQGQWRKGAWYVSELCSYALMGQDTSAVQGSYGNNIFLPETARPLVRPGVYASYGFYQGYASHVKVLQNELCLGRIIEPRSGLMLELAWTFRSQDPDLGTPLRTNYVRVGLSANLRDRHPLQTVRYVLN